MGLFDRFKKRVKEVADEVDSEALTVVEDSQEGLAAIHTFQQQEDDWDDDSEDQFEESVESVESEPSGASDDDDWDDWDDDDADEEPVVASSAGLAVLVDAVRAELGAEASSPRLSFF